MFSLLEWTATPGFSTLRSVTKNSLHFSKRFSNTKKCIKSLIFSFENYFQGNYTDFALLGLPAGAKVASAKVKIDL